MRKIYLFMTLSLDGCFEGIDHDISWHHVDSETNKFAIELLRQTDLFLWGRRIYQLMEDAWPRMAVDPSTSKDNLEIARLMNHTKKTVFSRTLERVTETENWTNVELRHEIDLEEIRLLKRQPGMDIGIGGSELALPLVRAGLVDEFLFMMSPIVIGAGTPIFKGLGERLELELVDSREFASGNVLLTYRPRSHKQKKN